MEEKKRVDGISILVYIAIVCLVLFIALPPILRLTTGGFNADLDDDVPNTVIEALQCRKRVTTEDGVISIVASTNYKDQNLTQFTLNYTASAGGENISYDWTTEEEIRSFQEIDGVTVDLTATTAKITVSADVFGQNLEHPFLMNYHQTKMDQQAFFESSGFTCQTISNQ